MSETSSVINQQSCCSALVHNPVVSSKWFAVALLASGAALLVIAGICSSYSSVVFAACGGIFIGMGGYLLIRHALHAYRIRTMSLHTAAEIGEMEAVNYLLSKNTTDVNALDKYGQTPLHRASHGGQLEVIQALLARNDMDVNAQATDNDSSATALHLAIAYKHPEAAKLLVADPRTNLDIQMDSELTPLHWAILYNDSETTTALLASKKRLNVNLVDNCGYTPLHLCIKNPSEARRQIAFALIKRSDILVNIQDNTNKQTPLFLAVDAQDLEIVQELLQKPGIDANLQDTQFKAGPLHLAAWLGHAEIVKALLAHPGINVDALDGRGRTARDCALKDEIKDLFPV